MARNVEKAKAILSRWCRLKKDISNTTNGKYKSFPKVQECVNLQECESERQEVLKVVSKLVMISKMPVLLFKNCDYGKIELKNQEDLIIEDWKDIDILELQKICHEFLICFSLSHFLNLKSQELIVQDTSFLIKQNTSYNKYGSKKQELQEILEKERKLKGLRKGIVKIIQGNQELVKDFNTREEILYFIKYEVDKRDENEGREIITFRF
ncbi:unnamed protein product [Paramecium octaurelia]|uniref:Uncharacterized protein n=1 Tax=Paramecium octaurelia TaxID=43137 RepID=A0A8S1VIT7_PAROT|nr:unnamed protein product [Paramecium octaurelia]